ncbi:MAG: 16S rRNA (guanine(527)-N(7))-methyltransferase RsmG [Eubacteriales bacterium]|nr:16S rRNA (guanine(527)-N(7))-methyltransferase RsmG [Eubacteriales bacterium]MDY3332440.1 16S rRNA (guanine(527)-N(7))-methyltransferase RsmG [Gallibacter sp.]
MIMKDKYDGVRAILSDLKINKTEDEIENIIEKLEIYKNEILKKNEFINLTSITKENEFIKLHYEDSLSVLLTSEMKKATNFIDIGTGGGFPGIPLAITFPDKKVVLLDSLKKRLKVITDITDEMGIKNVETIHGRAEEIARLSEHRDSYDLCLSRAVAPLNILLELCLPFCKVGGHFIAYKGNNYKVELDEAKKAIKELGAKLERVVVGNDIEDNELNHSLLIFKKISSTKKKYPRKPGTPKKEPIK